MDKKKVEVDSNGEKKKVVDFLFFVWSGLAEMFIRKVWEKIVSLLCVCVCVCVCVCLCVSVCMRERNKECAGGGEEV